MRLHPDTVARIKACHSVYSVGDTARHFNVSKSTVHDIWTGRRHTNTPAAPEPDNVKVSRISPDIIAEDAAVLMDRGMSLSEVAEAIGVSPNTVRKHTGGAAPCLLVY